MRRRPLPPEVWLILSDLAERLGMRSREDLLGWIDEGGMYVAGMRSGGPSSHPRAKKAAAAVSSSSSSSWARSVPKGKTKILRRERGGGSAGAGADGRRFPAVAAARVAEVTTLYRLLL